MQPQNQNPDTNNHPAQLPQAASGLPQNQTDVNAEPVTQQPVSATGGAAQQAQSPQAQGQDPLGNSGSQAFQVSGVAGNQNQQNPNAAPNQQPAVTGVGQPPAAQNQPQIMPNPALGQQPALQPQPQTVQQPQINTTNQPIAGGKGNVLKRLKINKKMLVLAGAVIGGILVIIAAIFLYQKFFGGFSIARREVIEDSSYSMEFPKGTQKIDFNDFEVAYADNKTSEDARYLQIIGVEENAGVTALSDLTPSDKDNLLSTTEQNAPGNIQEDLGLSEMSDEKVSEVDHNGADLAYQVDFKAEDKDGNKFIGAARIILYADKNTVVSIAALGFESLVGGGQSELTEILASYELK